MPGDFAIEELSLALLGLIAVAVLWLSLRPAVSRAESDRWSRIDARLDDLTLRLESLSEHLAEHRLQQAAVAAHTRELLGARFDGFQKGVSNTLNESQLRLVRAVGELRTHLSEHRTRLEQRQGESMKHLLEGLRAGLTAVQRQVGEALARSAEDLGRRLDGLTRSTDERLQEISSQVEKRLAEGFEKTTATFADVVQRLALIDEAQRKITELSSNVVSLQEILADKRSRGAFGEVQLAALVRNLLPESSFATQHELPNGRIADCVLFLPEPTGTVAVDAKFPLESYRRMTAVEATELERRAAERQFKIDIRTHIRDIAERYILPGATADGAVMFIPAEAVFAEIQGRHADLVEEANAKRVWMVSPTTLWAVLNTARAVLKDAATREQVHVIREHLALLGRDFDRFRGRMEALSRHIRQAHDDVQEVNTSARKISSRFERIERVELEAVPPPAAKLQKND